MRLKRHHAWWLGLLGLIGVMGRLGYGAEVDLAQVLPGPSVFYVGWSGAEAARPALNETAFGRMLAEPEFVRLCEALSSQVDAVLKKTLVTHGSEALHEPLNQALRLLWKHPGAINLMRFTLMKNGLGLEAAAVFHLGTDAEAFDRAVKALMPALIKNLKPSSTVGDVTIGQATLTQCRIVEMLPPITWGRVGEYFICTMGDNTPQAIVASLAGQSELPKLAASGEFAVSRKALAVDGGMMAFNWYVDLGAVWLRLPLVGTILDIVQGKKEATTQKQSGELPLGILLSRTIRALGLKDMKSLSGAVHLQGRGFRTAWFLSAPNSQGSVLKLFQQKPVTDADLAVVPRDATFFYSTNVDLNAFYQDMMTALKQIDPNMHQGWMEALAEGERAMGVELVKGFLEPLDDGWTLYCAPSSGGILGTGLTLVVETRDAPRVEESVTALARLAVEYFGPGHAVLSTTPAPGGQTVHFVQVKAELPYSVIAPAWAVAGRYLIVGLYPQTVVSAVERLTQGNLESDSIVGRQDFSIHRKHLPANSNAVCYLDAAEGFGTLYRLTLPLVQHVFAELSSAGIDLDVSLWPRAQTVERHLFGMVGGLAADERGVLMSSFAPLPIPVPSARSAAVVAGTLGMGVRTRATSRPVATGPGENR